MQRYFLGLAGVLIALVSGSPVAAATIGLDNVHRLDVNTSIATGNQFESMRSTITAMGYTVVPVNAFDAATLSTLDGLMLRNSYSTDAKPYTSSEIASIVAFTSNAAFVSDASMFSDTGEGSDRPISFGDNTRLLQNVTNFIGSGHGTFFIADDGGTFNVTNFNALVSPYGITYASTATDSSGRTVTGILPHTITAGVSTLGIDFQLPMTITGPAIDLTSGGGQDNILAVIPEPAGLLGVCALLLAVRRNRSKR